MELLGQHFQDARLLAMAYPYEQAMSPRVAPSVTPQLVNGAAPASQTIEMEFDRQQTVLQARFEVDITRNSFRYELMLDAANRAEVYAVTLSIDADQDQELNDPIVLNLMGPAVQRSSGEQFMSGAFRAALSEGRLYVKVFADLLPITGATQRIQ
jgi:hypothetical protein